ncbi:hypothetical protein [Herbaspirillum sp. NPDC101396]|uniref:hypothetical protein n=1 Tax=Herbaspirillum sp. NPDC101396 TaxID=3364005 RepID=UPI00383B84F2
MHAGILEPTVTKCRELIVPSAVRTIGSMTDSTLLNEFARRMNEICGDMQLPERGRQTALGQIFKVSQKGARKWLEGEAFPRWEHIVAITEWADVTVDWLVAGRGPKRLTTLYPSESIARTVEVMKQLDPEQQALVTRLADQVAQSKKDDITEKRKAFPRDGTND